MYRAVQDIFCGGKTYGADETISPSTIAGDVQEVHEKLDELKLWSSETGEWLESHIEDCDNPERLEELEDLKHYVDTVLLRIENGDINIRQIANEEQNND